MSFTASGRRKIMAVTIDEFREHCETLSKTVPSSYARWLENEKGDELYELYCVDCAVNESYRQRHLKRRTKGRDGGFTRVSGWNESVEAISQCFCGTCGMLLECSLLENGIKEEIEFLAECDDLEPGVAWTVARFLGGFGCFNEAEHWPQIEPHAARLMRRKES